MDPGLAFDPNSRNYLENPKTFAGLGFGRRAHVGILGICKVVGFWGSLLLGTMWMIWLASKRSTAQRPSTSTCQVMPAGPYLWYLKSCQTRSTIHRGNFGCKEDQSHAEILI